MNTTTAQFAQDMKAARKRRGWSQARLACESNAAGAEGVTQVTISRIELGEHEPKLSHAVAIATALGFHIAGVSNDEQVVVLRDRLARIAAITQEVRDA